MHQTPCPITGKWGSWTPWSSCNADCGGGTMRRIRECNRPLPSNGGDNCEGHPEETAICNMQSCSPDPLPVDGGWSFWGPWTSCSADCGEGTKTRRRECNQPPPSNGGAFCRGSSDEKARCNINNCPVDGGWGSWSPYSKCNKICGGGDKERTRQCNNPTPSHGGAVCSGESNQIESCNPQACAKDGGWGAWSSYSSCSRTCGGGEKKRPRQCDNPAPSDGGAECMQGPSNQTESCNTQECGPSCRLKYNGGVMKSIKITWTSQTFLSVWGSSSCTLRILAVGGGGGEQIM